MRHHRDRALLTMDVLFAEFVNGTAIRFAQFDSKMRIGNPTHRRFLDQERTLGRGNQQHEEFHAHSDDMRAAQAASAIREVFRHAARVEDPVGIIGGAGYWRTDVSSFVRTKRHRRRISLLMIGRYRNYLVGNYWAMVGEASIHTP